MSNVETSGKVLLQKKGLQVYPCDLLCERTEDSWSNMQTTVIYRHQDMLIK